LLSTVRKIITPGLTTNHGDFVAYWNDLASMLPRLAVGGWPRSGAPPHRLGMTEARGGYRGGTPIVAGRAGRALTTASLGREESTPGAATPGVLCHWRHTSFPGGG
jgi:hypothetical protein